VQATGKASVISARKHLFVSITKAPTVRGVLARFLDCSRAEVEGFLSGQIAHLNETEVTHDLERPLSDGDVLSVFPRGVADYGIRGELSMARFSGIQVDMPYKESRHRLPHFHINGHVASIAWDGTLLDGSLKGLTRSQKRQLDKWISDHKQDIRENWDRRQRGIEMIPIGPWE